MSLQSEVATDNEISWVQHLKKLIDPKWRPGEFNFDSLVLIPDVSNPFTLIQECNRDGCQIQITSGDLCPTCRNHWLSAKQSGTSRDVWEMTPRPPLALHIGCLVTDCHRDHTAHGLCRNHLASYHRRRRRLVLDVSGYEPRDWIRDCQPQGFPPAPGCVLAPCVYEKSYKTGLCALHQFSYQRWSRRRSVGTTLDSSFEEWLAIEAEPPLDGESQLTLSAASATPFALISEPVRWEFLYAVQQRDQLALSVLAPNAVRGTYLDLRRMMQPTLVGQTKLGRRTGKDANLTGMLVEWQRLIDEAHRAWSGVDSRDPRIVYLRDVELRDLSRKPGPNSKLDLRPIKNEWIAEAVTMWVHAAARSENELRLMAATWQTADDVLTQRGTPPHALGSADLSAIVEAVRKRWKSARVQTGAIRCIDRLIDFARQCKEIREVWSQIPARFSVNPAIHKASLSSTSDAPSSDEPFRFVPQPIVDWVMDHLHLVVRSTPYATAEARAMIFLQERCGRRTGETIRLLDDCISLDHQEAPYLIWRQGKPPYALGKRLPIHQETLDVIRQWQELKKEHGVQSKWLFPSRRTVRVDKPYDPSYLSVRVNELVNVINERAPYSASVEGAEGNLVHFDLTTIDPYAFRHAFAQRLADATDENGHSTTPPDVLQEFMGHKSYNTTMAYFAVTAKRRQKAMEAIVPRRLNLKGEIVDVTRERDGFNKIAVTLGHCTEPQNVAAGGHSCALEHSCESCPFFLVDPLEQDGISAKRHQLRIKLERARIIDSPQHMLDHFTARINDCTSIIQGIDAYVDGLNGEDRNAIRQALDSMADIRRRSTAPRSIDLRKLLAVGDSDGA